MSRVQQGGWLLAGLSAVALLLATLLYVAYRAQSIPVPFRVILVMQLGLWYCWAVAGPIVWSLAARWPLQRGVRLRHAARHAATAVLVALLVVAVYGVIFQVMVRIPWSANAFRNEDRSVRATAVFVFAAYFHIELLVYAAVIAVAHAVQSNRELVAREREALQLSSQLANARLQVLTAQLQPHFLFNTLHTIGALILQRKNDAAVQTVAELGDLLRITLDRQSATLIALRDELEHLDRYLRIEQTRFADRLNVRWDVDPAALEWRVPPFILQPVVENALKHGIAARVEAGTIELRATVSDRVLRVSVYNDGPTLPTDWAGHASFGFGLRNVHERLGAVGRGCSVDVHNAGESGVLATVELAHA